jgi:hypothetical protein
MSNDVIRQLRDYLDFAAGEPQDETTPRFVSPQEEAPWFRRGPALAVLAALVVVAVGLPVLLLNTDDLAPPVGAATAGTWQVTSFTIDGEDQVVQPGVNTVVIPWVTISDGEVEGAAGCNGFGGPITFTDDGSASMTDVAMEAAFCGPDDGTLMQAEFAFGAVMWSDNLSIEVDGDEMVWSNGSDSIVFASVNTPPTTVPIVPPPQTSVGRLDCSPGFVEETRVADEGQDPLDIAQAANPNTVAVEAGGPLRYSGVDANGEVVVELALGDSANADYQVWTCADQTSAPDTESFDVVRPVPLTIYAPNANGTTIAAVDLNSGVTTTYSQTLTESIQGMSSDWSGRVVGWTYDPAVAVYEGSLTQPIFFLEGESLGPLANAPSLRATLTTERDGLWIINPNADASNAVLFNLADRQQVLVADVPGNAFPVAARGTGMVFNTEGHVETDEGVVAEAGSERVVTLNTGGQVNNLGPGKAIAATDRYIAMLVCPTGTEAENCYVNQGTGRNDLVIVDTESGQRITVTKPSFGGEPLGDAGDWTPVGGPLVPSEAMPLNTISPDGTELLVRLGRGVDVNGVPMSSVLVAVDLASGQTRIAAENQTETPLATWSRDGNSIITIHYVAEGRIDITVIETNNPDNTFTYQDLIPDNHFPLAAG